LSYHAEARATNVVTGVSDKYNIPTATAAETRFATDELDGTLFR